MVMNTTQTGPAERIFKWGGLTRTRKREPTRGPGGMLPRENLKYYSSEMARNASKKR